MSKCEVQIIEEQNVTTTSIKMKFYHSYEEVMVDLDMMRTVGHSNSNNRGEGYAFPVCKSGKQILGRIISSSSWIAQYGRIGPGNLYLVGRAIWDSVIEHKFEKIDEGATKLCERLLPYEVLCCKLFPKDWENPKCYKFDNNFPEYPVPIGKPPYERVETNDFIFNPFYQFCGFTAIMESHLKAKDRDEKINEIIGLEEIVYEETFTDKIKNIVKRW